MTVTSSKVCAFTTLRARDGCFDELLDNVQHLVAAAREEAGTEVYFVSNAEREPGTLLVFELFTDQDALRLHVQGAARMAAALEPLLASSEVVLGQPVAAKGLEL